MITPTQAQEMSAIDPVLLSQLQGDIDRKLGNCFKVGCIVTIPLDGYPDKVIERIVEIYAGSWSIVAVAGGLAFSAP